MQKQKRVGDFNSGQALTFGLLLLIPLIIVASITHLVPTAQTLAASQTDFNMLRDSEFIGGENFARMFEDKRFLMSITNTIPYVFLRIIIAALVPALVGGLIGMQARVGRIINRALLSLIAVFIVPTSLGILWRLYWSPTWGTEQSPVFSEMMALSRPDSAAISLQWLDSLLITAIAAFIGGIAFIAVMRGQRKLMAGLGVGLLGAVIAGASAFLIFDLPFVTTAGGPGNATSTYVLEVYNSGFRTLRIGYASAQVSILAVGAAIVGLILGIISIGFNLRIVPLQRSAEDSGSNIFSLASIPLLLIFLLPIAGLVWWGYNQATQYEAFERISEVTNWSALTTNSMMPWFAIWFIHLPITFMAGLALGFFRPFGRVGSNILFVVLLMITIIPTEVLMFSWFMMSRDMELLNQPIVLGLPWLVNGLSLLVFKMLFDGTRESYYAAVEDGESSQQAFSNRVMLPGVLMVVAIGIILSFISSHSLLWALISQNAQENQTPAVALMIIANGFGIEPGFTNGAASMVIMGTFLVFLVLFVGIQVVIFERFKIEGGSELAVEHSHKVTQDDTYHDMDHHNIHGVYADDDDWLTESTRDDNEPYADDGSSTDSYDDGGGSDGGGSDD